MRSSSTPKGKVVANGIDTPVENGLSNKEEADEGEEAHRLAAKVVENVVKLASEAAEQRAKDSPPTKVRGCELQRLPTFQIDTVPSPPWSPVEEPVDEEQIDIQLEEEQQSTDSFSDEQRDSLRSFIEDIISKAMVVAEKKLQFVGLDDDDEEEEEEAQQAEEVLPPPPQEVQEEEGAAEEEEKEGAESRLTEEEEAEIRAAAEKVVEEVLSKAEEVVAEKMVDTSKFDFPITFDEAPDDVKDVASNLIKEIVGKAITMAEEKSVPTVPFNFEDVDLIKSSGPWYVRVREGFMRVLRTACFCTPRRHDS